MRLARIEDIPSLAALKRVIGWQAYRSFTTRAAFEEWAAQTTSRTYFERAVLGPGSVGFILEGADAADGMVFIRRRGRSVWLSDLYCRYPGTGSGSRLLQQCVGTSQVARVREIECEVFSGNHRALVFFARNAFVIRDAQRSTDFSGQQLLVLARTI